MRVVPTVSVPMIDSVYVPLPVFFPTLVVTVMVEVDDPGGGGIVGGLKLTLTPSGGRTIHLNVRPTEESYP